MAADLFKFNRCVLHIPRSKQELFFIFFMLKNGVVGLFVRDLGSVAFVADVLEVHFETNFFAIQQSPGEFFRRICFCRIWGLFVSGDGARERKRDRERAARQIMPLNVGVDILFFWGFIPVRFASHEECISTQA